MNEEVGKKMNVCLREASRRHQNLSFQLLTMRDGAYRMKTTLRSPQRANLSFLSCLHKDRKCEIVSPVAISEQRRMAYSMLEGAAKSKMTAKLINENGKSANAYNLMTSQIPPHMYKDKWGGVVKERVVSFNLRYNINCDIKLLLVLLLNHIWTLGYQ